VKKQLETKKKGRKWSLTDEKGITVAILIALIIVSSIVVGYYIAFRPKPVGFSAISLLDSQKQASNYPDLVVLNKNSTFTVWVDVENHMGITEQYQVQLKITKNTYTFPVNVPANSTFEKTLEDGQKWENQVTVSMIQAGNYSVVFELYLSKDGTYQFTNNYCVLNIQVK
jgi:uncharacterized membrane protein